MKKMKNSGVEWIGEIPEGWELSKIGQLYEERRTKVTDTIYPPLSPKSTQKRIAAYLDKKCSKIEETIQNQQQVIEKLKEYKKSLIYECVTGKKEI